MIQKIQGSIKLLHYYDIVFTSTELAKLIHMSITDFDILYKINLFFKTPDRRDNIWRSLFDLLIGLALYYVNLNHTLTYQYCSSLVKRLSGF